MPGIVPGVFTVGNMFCGFLSILSSLDGQAKTAAWLIVMAGFFDALDGWIARFSRTASKFGIELDSFADFVSFAIAPAVMLYSFELFVLGKWGFLLGFVFIVTGAFRLARFNLGAKSEKKLYYTGLPIPMAAVTFAGYVLFCNEIWGALKYPEFLISMIIAFSALMVSSLKYDTLPNTNFRSRHNNLKLLYTLIAIAALFIKPQLVFFPVGIIYVLSGLAREAASWSRFAQAETHTREELHRAENPR
jgi:CDP-diacylglycerol--serine O-phosphatidyltransferase